MDEETPQVGLERPRHVSTTRPIAIVGFVLLATPPVVLFVLGILGALLEGETMAMGAVLFVATGGVGVGILYEWETLRSFVERTTGEDGGSGWLTLAILGGTLLTFVGVVELGASPIVAASAVGIGAALVVPASAVPAYCGAFVGMTSPLLFTTYWHAAVASTIASGVFLVARPVFLGVGGKLGTTAFVGVLTTVVATAGTFQSGSLPGSTTVGLVASYAIVGAVVTFGLHTRSGASPVLASGLVGAVGGLLLPIAHGDPGRTMAAAVFSASFAGMTDPKRIPDERWIGLAGLLVGVLVVYTTPYLGGSGGKLGTVAFGSCLAVHGVLRTTNVVRLRRRIEEFSRRDTT